MIRDITLGQYFPGTSAVHRLDPRMKILLTIAYMVMLFMVSSTNFPGLAVAAGFMVIVAAISRIPLKMVFRGIRPLVPIIILTAVINAFYVPGRTLWHYGFITVTYEGVALAVFMSVRIIFLIIGTSMMTYTTSPIALTDGLERLMSPLKKFHMPVHELSMMMTIALRFIPTLIEETDKIISAQKARGADFETGNIVRRMKALIPILIPLFVSAFRRAEELALAMDCRCYKGGEGRTRMRQLKLSAVDFVAAAVTAAVFAGIICMNIFMPKLF
jgi:energy-coupling factor transport system permease protein